MRPKDAEVIQDYIMHAADALTIDPTKKLEKENQDLKKDYLGELSDLRQEFNEMKIYLTNLGKDRRKRLVNDFVLKSNDELQDQCFETES